jgi:multiple antibiotic resistance protein
MRHARSAVLFCNTAVIESPRQFMESVLLVIGALLPIVGPLSTVPLYLRSTAGIDASAREPLARLVAFDCFLLLLGSAVAGPYVLNFFGVSIADVQLAGGLVVCALAWSLLAAPEWCRLCDAVVARPRDARRRLATARVLSAHDAADGGPGSISVALTLGAHRASTIRASLFGALADAVGMAVVAAAVYLCYRYGDVILRKLGTTGVAVLTRLSAFLSLCVGVHIAWSGAHALLAHASA